MIRLAIILIFILCSPIRLYGEDRATTILPIKVTITQSPNINPSVSATLEPTTINLSSGFYITNTSLINNISNLRISSYGYQNRPSNNQKINTSYDNPLDTIYTNQLVAFNRIPLKIPANVYIGVDSKINISNGKETLPLNIIVKNKSELDMCLSQNDTCYLYIEQQLNKIPNLTGLFTFYGDLPIELYYF